MVFKVLFSSNIPGFIKEDTTNDALVLIKGQNP